jgi:hypothetical protein
MRGSLNGAGRSTSRFREIGVVHLPDLGTARHNLVTREEQPHNTGATITADTRYVN